MIVVNKNVTLDYILEGFSKERKDELAEFINTPTLVASDSRMTNNIVLRFNRTNDKVVPNFSLCHDVIKNYLTTNIDNFVNPIYTNGILHISDTQLENYENTPIILFVGAGEEVRSILKEDNFLEYMVNLIEDLQEKTGFQYITEIGTYENKHQPQYYFRFSKQCMKFSKFQYIIMKFIRSIIVSKQSADQHMTTWEDIKKIRDGSNTADEDVFDELKDALFIYDALSFLTKEDLAVGPDDKVNLGRYAEYLIYAKNHNIHCFKKYVKKYEKEITEFQNQKKTEPMSKNPYLTKNPINVKVFSRHPSHAPLRDMRINARVLVRFGSGTPTSQKDVGRYIEINQPEAVQTSSNRILMKRAFDSDENIKHAKWHLLESRERLEAWINASELQGSSFVIKSQFGSRNRGNTFCQTLDDLYREVANKYNRNYIVERFYNYSREYRLHVTNEGCFYTCRKMIRRDIPENQRWFRNDSNSVWIMEENPQFDKPVNWKEIEANCVAALNVVGLDVGACDVRIQSATDSKDRRRESPDFIICEVNSAPSFGDITLERYQNMIANFVTKKIKK